MYSSLAYDSSMSRENSLPYFAAKLTCFLSHRDRNKSKTNCRLSLDVTTFTPSLCLCFRENISCDFPLSSHHSHYDTRCQNLYFSYIALSFMIFSKLYFIPPNIVNFEFEFLFSFSHNSLIRVIILYIIE